MLTLQEIISAVEETYGEVFDSEEQCPGVYYLACRPVATELADDLDGELAEELSGTLPSELVVVERDCPHISDAAKAYGSPLDGYDDLIVYDYNAERGGREVVLYEAYRYLVRNKLPIPDGSTLLSSAAYYADDYPEYFGLIPAPVVTPRGFMTRYLMLANGIFALETDTGARLIAIAGIFWSLELQDTTKALGMKVANLSGDKVPVEVQHLFFTEEDGCLALFELLPARRALAESARLDKLALMNAIWSYHPEYALAHNLREQQGLNDMLGLILNDAGFECEQSGSAKNKIALSDKAGTEYVRW